MTSGFRNTAGETLNTINDSQSDVDIHPGKYTGIFRYYKDTGSIQVYMYTGAQVD